MAINGSSPSTATRNLATASVEGLPVLLLHAAGDEAFRWLKLIEWVPTLAQHLTRMFDVVGAWWQEGKLKGLLARIYIVVAVVAAACLMIYALVQDVQAGTLPTGAWWKVPLNFIGAVVLGLLLPILAYLVLAGVGALLLTVAEVLSFGAKPIAFGLPTWKYEVTTEAGLVGGATIRQLPLQKDASGLWHSQSYLHPDVPEIVAGWIKSLPDRPLPREVVVSAPQARSPAAGS